MDQRDTFIVSEGGRLDKILSQSVPDISRSRWQTLIESGLIIVNATAATAASQKVKEGDEISYTIPEAEEDDTPHAEDIELDVVYEDDDLLVINKPAGLVVHPAAGHYEGTLVNALLHHCGDSLSGINGVKRPGIVHRLDKDTSGLMLVAKNDLAHHALAAQLSDRTLGRTYHALVLDVPKPLKGHIETFIGRHPQSRLKQAVLRAETENARDAITHYHVVENYGGLFARVECHLETGRTHQIRVHMQHIFCPLLGDPLYGPQKNAVTAKLQKSGLKEAEQVAVLGLPRQALHAIEIHFEHPRSGENMSFSSKLAPDLEEIAKTLKKIA
ncbi:MAG: RluA family pseudouridine synthase [Alphaproteobacteria bacterium]|nr:RluA family pseudouridine synthase [Alphaproteobacteria bacterium]